MVNPEAPHLHLNQFWAKFWGSPSSAPPSVADAVLAVVSTTVADAVLAVVSTTVADAPHLHLSQTSLHPEPLPSIAGIS